MAAVKENKLRRDAAAKAAAARAAGGGGASPSVSSAKVHTPRMQAPVYMIQACIAGSVSCSKRCLQWQLSVAQPMPAQDEVFNPWAHPLGSSCT
jgi:hypothetical protein